MLYFILQSLQICLLNEIDYSNYIAESIAFISHHSLSNMLMRYTHMLYTKKLRLEILTDKNQVF